MLSLNRLHEYGIDVFDLKERYYTWLETPNANLAGVRPIELLEDLDGLEMVISQLFKIQSAKTRLCAL